jgi:hypothetical protein
MTMELNSRAHSSPYLRDLIRSLSRDSAFRIIGELPFERVTLNHLTGAREVHTRGFGTLLLTASIAFEQRSKPPLRAGFGR